MRENLRRLVYVLVFAIPYVPLVFGHVPGEGWLAGLWVAAAGVVAPGAAGALLPRGRGSARWFVRALFAAAFLNVMTALGLNFVGLEPTPGVFAGVLGFATLNTAAYGLAWGGALPGPRREPWYWVAGLAAMMFAAWMGTSVVPALEDQDSEVQGTAYGLAHELEPICLTNRSTTYFFAHPLLLHALNAGTLTLAGDLETVRPAYDAAKKARAEAGPPERGLAAARDAFVDPAPRTDHSFLWFTEVFRPFQRDAALTATRAPNFALAGAVAILLFAWIRRLGASPIDAALAVTAYVTLPEIAVRSGYGGYYALTAATFLAGARLASGWYGGARSGYLAGVEAALANQKVLILGAAVFLWRVVGSRVRPAVVPIRALLPWLVGLGVGAAAFWAYGLALAPSEFVTDHLLEHGMNRFSGGEVLSRQGDAVYASRIGVWGDFARNFGWGWCALALAGAVLLVRSALGTLRDANADRPADHRNAYGILALWIVLGAVAFTATDWRQTKHLCLLVPALTVGIGYLAAVSRGTWRIVVRALLLGAIFWNAWMLSRVAQDFASLVVRPVW